MATIVVLTHALDRFEERSYLVRGLFPTWEALGHRVVLRAGVFEDTPGDVLLQHVDASVVPPEYRATAARFRTTVNGRVADVRKRVVSRSLVQRGDDWPGAVVVKADLNCGGIPERMHDLAAIRRGLEPPHRAGPVVERYEVLPSWRAVPERVWDDPRLVVERFLPERDEHGYWLRVWVFLGDRERCHRYAAREPIVKGARVLSREPAPIPDEIRAERARIGLDFGKIDFVVHEGRPVLLDANPTPGAPPTSARSSAAAAALAAGIDALVGR
jgi:hypothetical protein